MKPKTKQPKETSNKISKLHNGVSSNAMVKKKSEETSSDQFIEISTEDESTEQQTNVDIQEQINNDEHLDAPNILLLNDDEKFRDDKGNIAEIETRGERKEDCVYFLGADVAKIFNMPNIRKTLTSAATDYVLEEHYKYFITTVKRIHSKASKSKRIFITYKGMLKICLSSRSPVAKTFSTWASKTLFTAHMGTQDAKDQLAADLIGTNVETVKNAFRTFVNAVPCVYLFFIGHASECLKNDKTIKYKKNDLLCRFGMTKDILKRTSQHEKTFKEEFNKDIELVCCSIIDPKYVSKAEIDIKAYFKNNIIAYKDSKNHNHAELIVIDKKYLNSAKQYYESLQQNFVGVHDNMARQLAAYEQKLKDQAIMYESQIKDKTHEIQMKCKDYEMLLKDKDNELIKKDNEILLMKISLLESRAHIPKSK